VSQVSQGVTEHLVGSGAILRVREHGGYVLAESLAGTETFAKVSGTAAEPGVAASLIAAISNESRREDVRRILAKAGIVADSRAPLMETAA
jgi:hypothetical protein